MCNLSDWNVSQAKFWKWNVFSLSTLWTLIFIYICYSSRPRIMPCKQGVAISTLIRILFIFLLRNIFVWIKPFAPRIPIFLLSKRPCYNCKLQFMHKHIFTHFLYLSIVSYWEEQMTQKNERSSNLCWEVIRWVGNRVVNMTQDNKFSKSYYSMCKCLKANLISFSSLYNPELILNYSDSLKFCYQK